MRCRFNYHDFIAYVVPGLMPLLVGVLIIFARGHYRLFFFIQTFVGLILLLIAAYVMGHFIQAVGAWAEKKIFFDHGYHPGEAYFKKGSGLLSDHDYGRLLQKYRERFGVELTDEMLTDPHKREHCFNEIRWGVKDEVRAEYIRTLDAYYDLYRGFFVSFIICVILSVPIGLGLVRVPHSASFYQKVFLFLILIGSIIAEYISARRTQDYLQAYTREVVNAFLAS
jgi:hypothetical protein